MSAHWYFGTTHGSGVSVESSGRRTIITLPNHMTIVARGSVSFTSTSNRNPPGRRGPAHADAEYHRHGQRRHRSGRGRPWPGRGRGRGRRERYNRTGRHDGQQRGELSTNAPGLEDRITLPNGHASALAITNANTTNKYATPYEDTITTNHDHYATFPSTNAESMTVGQIGSAAYENANTSGITAGLHAISISKATVADRARATTTDGLSHDPAHIICPKNEVDDALMSWDETSVNETTVGTIRSGSTMTIRELVTSNDPGAVNGFVDGDREVHRPLIADNASDTSTL
ncbi:predicted protein [Aspergillus nidulans FGSC A4]|uniref:Uncharacterized protein n=1 Tax=Emericella nidulans (strain FGSC A4 / ATCC 38163 / CBS 112.46 / NRRL 194 / M139) TaxID=227321 RepID=Q5B7S1_EMENI|nr:hypothetical protein [Aspergillus nidulans FGSC A4]EAA63377.1 predicted protein [Aspergillus nidulans FGSC A4]CBF82766.1 TPA: hypothetical protein ANIA_03409 [Aspergillus nidulans FGSC A4]|eukprot:XP_661013.1 predicted protein [Aspergillus nidulans FGSC A4]